MWGPFLVSNVFVYLVVWAKEKRISPLIEADANVLWSCALHWKLKMSFTNAFTPSFTQLSLSLLLFFYHWFPLSLLPVFLSLSFIWIYKYISASVYTSQLLTIHSLTLIGVFIIFVFLSCFLFCSFVFPLRPSCWMKLAEMQEEEAAKDEEEEEEAGRDTTPNEWLREWGSHVSLFQREAGLGEELCGRCASG